eukprot:scaffold57423_cov22-Tisochrysis_lutea.AAC.3
MWACQNAVAVALTDFFACLILTSSTTTAAQCTLAAQWTTPAQRSLVFQKAPLLSTSRQQPVDALRAD